MNRRNFMQTTAAFGAASMFNIGGNIMASAATPLNNIGIQLYSIRDMMSKNMEASLAKVAEIGFKEVEFFNYYDRSANDVKAMLDANGLMTPSIHVDIAQLRGDNLKREIEYANTLGQEYITLAWLGEENRKSMDQYKEHAALFQTVGEECNKAGLKFAYHNHEFEFIEFDGVKPYEMLLEQLSGDIMLMEMDLHWIIVANEDPFKYFAKYPGRFPMCHVKDRDMNGNMVNVGKGAIDFNAIFAKASQAGLKHFFVEHDEPTSEIEFMTDSFSASKSFVIS